MHTRLCTFFSLLALVLLSHQQYQPQVVDARIIFATGSNERGQLGKLDALVFQPVFPSTTKISSFCAAEDHVFAVSDNNNVYTFGINSASQMGLGSGVAQADVPVMLTSPLLSNTTSNQVSCGSQSSLVYWTGQALCMGSNSNGQCAVADTSASYPTPQQSAAIGAGGFTRIVSAQFTSFGLTASAMWSWGINNFGQAGIDSAGATVTTPTLVPTAGMPVTSVAIGSNFALILLNNGSVMATGSNSVGQLGINSYIPPQRYGFEIVDLGGKTATKIAAGGTSALVYTSDGSLYGFGSNECGQLTNLANPTLTPTLLNTSTLDGPISQMAVSNQFSIVITTSGKFYLSGLLTFAFDIQQGQTCMDSSISYFQYIPSFTVPSGSVTSLVATPRNIYLLTSNNQLLSIGLITKSGLGSRTMVPTPIAVPNNVLIDRVYAGYQMSMATQVKQGYVYAWGRNSDLGVINRNGYDIFVPQLLALNNTLGLNVTDIQMDAGTIGGKFLWNVFFLQNDTLTIYGYGSNSEGQLAIGTTPDILTQPIEVDISNDTNTVKLQSGIHHSIYMGLSPPASTPPVVQTMGMYCWGSNSEGQLGLSQEKSRASRFRLKTGIIDVAAGDTHTVYVDGTNQLSVMGDNSKGQLGIGLILRRSDPEQINSTMYPYLSNATIVSVSTCSEGTIVVTSKGWVVFGDNTNGALGMGSNYTYIVYPTQHTILEQLIPDPANNVLKISCAKNGGKHGAILTKDGTLYVFGQNDKGQLGLGDTVTRYTPAILTVPTTYRVLDVSAGRDHTLIVTGQRSCPNNCNLNRGTCNTVQGVCNCYVEYAGYDCSLYNCIDPFCNGKGTCDQTQGMCICNPGFAGESCTFRQCINNCNGNGQCNRNSGACVCDPGWTGEDCGTGSNANAIVLSFWTLLFGLVVSFCFV